MSKISPKPLEEWKAECESSGYVRPHETVEFLAGRADGAIMAVIPNAALNGSSIVLGYYFTKDDTILGVSAGQGWCHDE